ncbi:MAG TPA: hypothetical protein VI670_24340 [Thermoanaerobaculia bacterium]
MLSSHNEDFRVTQNRAQEVMACAKLLSELFPRIDSRVDLTAQLSLCRRQSRDQAAEGDASDHEQVDVASGASRAPRHGAVDERNLDRTADLGERAADDISGTEGLQEDSLQIGKNR